MEIPDRLYDDVQRRVIDKWRNSPCEGCGAQQWGLNANVLELGDFYPGQPTEAVHRVPVALFVCGNCGLFRLVSAVTAGLTNPDTGELANG